MARGNYRERGGNPELIFMDETFSGFSSQQDLSLKETIDKRRIQKEVDRRCVAPQQTKLNVKIVKILSSQKFFISYQNTIRMKVSTTPRGSLIVFEGCDRSGKTTQCAKLVESLQAQGEEVKLMKFPDRTTTIGTLINNYLQMSQELDDRVVHLLFSANRWEAIESMKKSLKSGTTLIVDRYAYSGIAYSAAKGLDLEWCRNPDIGLIKPDKVIYLSVNEKIMSERANYGSERYEKIDFQQRVHNIFLQLQEPYWQNVSADGSIDVIHKEINTIVSETIRDSKVKPLLKLWTDGEIL